MDNANSWLADNLACDLVKCESVRHRLDHHHRINPESTCSDDRSYVIGLRSVESPSPSGCGISRRWGWWWSPARRLDR